MPQAIFRPALLLLVVSLLVPQVLVAGAQQPPFLTLEPGLPLVATTFATGLNFPTGMVELPDGSLLVGTSNPTGGSFFSSTGELVRLVDSDGDRIADGAPQIVATGLAGAVTAVAKQNDLVFVTSVESRRERIQILRGGGDWLGPYDPVGELVFSFAGFAHQSYGLATRTSPIDPGVIELYFNVGARGNDTGGGAVQVGGALSARLMDSSIYMVPVTDTGEQVTIGDPVQIASGLRNAMGFGFHPGTGDLWITDNGIDGLEEVWIAHSADELNVIPANQIGRALFDFGFPHTYTLYSTGEIIGTGGAQPIVAFVPQAGNENEGAASLAFAPDSFQDGLNSGVLVGFHGQYDLSGPENEENPLLYIDLDTLEVTTIVSVDAPGIGHLDGLLATTDAVYVADLCAGSSMANAAPCGTIFRIGPVPS
ncbi:hypothetical protein BH23CHL5_BH23CHL5_09340 [soil metagenome]